MQMVDQMQLSSRVQMRRTCTFVMTVLPEATGASRSRASHQHFRYRMKTDKLLAAGIALWYIELTAGFRQNNSSFCAVANCVELTLISGGVYDPCEFASYAVSGLADKEDCEMPVLSGTRAILVIQHRFGSIDR